jgi:hypothetical protein
VVASSSRSTPKAPVADQVQGVGLVALAEHHISGGEVERLEQGEQVPQPVAPEAGEGLGGLEQSDDVVVARVGPALEEVQQARGAPPPTPSRAWGR